MDDKEQHLFMLALSTRDADMTDEMLTKFEDRALALVSEMKKEDFVKHSSKTADCKYTLTAEDL